MADARRPEDDVLEAVRRLTELPRSGSQSSDAELSFSVPWDSMAPCHIRFGRDVFNDPDGTGAGELIRRSMQSFVAERSHLQEVYVRESARTERLSMILSAFMAVAAGCILIFAPEGKQLLANWVGAVLFVGAAGAAGYRKIWMKTRIAGQTTDLGADSNSLPFRRGNKPSV